MTIDPDANDSGQQDTSAADETVDRLNEANRILLEARMLPRGQKLTDEQTQTIREQFNDYMDKRGIKPARVAREIDFGDAVISDWRKGKYKGNNDKVTHAINDWMERDRRREDVERPKGYVKTWIAETMRMIAHQADKRSAMAAIVVPSGAGKTMVLEALTEEMRGIYLYCDPNITERELLYKLAYALGWRNKIGAKIAMRQYIIDELKGSRRPILLDEAQNLTKAIQTVRAIFDQAKVPIMMAGTREIMNFIDDRSDGRGQFSSRTIRFNVIDSLRTLDGPGGGNKTGRDLFTKDEIKAFFASKNIRLSIDGLNMMWLLACLANHGTLRLIDHVAGLAMEINKRAEVITPDMIVEALEMFRGPTDAAALVKWTRQYEVLAKAG